MASANISFDSIPSSIRKPGKYFEFNTKLSVRTLPGNRQKVLIIGQRLSTGTVAANTPVDVFSDDDAAAYFGRGSVAHLMCRAALVANPYLSLSAIGQSDAGGATAATGTITLTGTTTAAGTLTVRIGGAVVEQPVAAGDTVNAIASALAGKLNSLKDLPVTAAAVAGVVTLTAKNGGTIGNAITLSASNTVTGLNSASATMAGGASDPDFASPLSIVFALGHHIIVSPYSATAQLTTLRTHLDNVSGPMEQRGAIGVYAHTGTLANATTGAASINSGRITGILAPSAYDMNYEIAAAYAAVIAGEEDPARPLNTLALTGISAPPLANRMSRTEQESCLNNGITPSEVGPGEKLQIVRAVTTYTLDPQGVNDISMLDLTTIRTLDYVRTACRERISLRFPREKLSARTPNKVRGELLDVLFKLEELEIVELVEDNKPGVLVERDLQDPNRLNARIPVDVVNGLHVFAGRIDLLL